MANKLDIVIEPHSEDFDSNDDRWIEQVNDFFDECSCEVGEIRKEVTAQEGKKGGLEEMILALASSTAVEIALNIFKTWLQRDRTRSLKIKIKNGNEVKEMELSGKGFKKEELEKYMLLALNLQNNKNE